MWIVWIVALVLIGVGAVLWMHRLDGVERTPPAEPPYVGSGGATDGSEGDGKPQGPPNAT